MLAKMGKKTIIVDTDPQCNLTGLVLGYKKMIELEDFYKTGANHNIRDGLKPAFESMPKLLEAVNCVEVDENNNLLLLPGHIRLAEYDVTLGIAQELSGAIQTLKNLPGAIHYLINKTSEKYNAEYVLLDMSPSLSSLNQNLLMSCDYFIVPTSPDYYSVMAIDSLAIVLEKWVTWAKTAQSLFIFKNADYPFPNTLPKLLGTIIQKYRPRGKGPSKGFQYWIDEINRTVLTKLIPVLEKENLMLPKENYSKLDLFSNNYVLANIPDFNTLIATSQETQKPVFELNDEDIKHVGTVLANSLESVEKFNGIFTDLTNKVIDLTK